MKSSRRQEKYGVKLDRRSLEVIGEARPSREEGKDPEPEEEVKKVPAPFATRRPGILSVRFPAGKQP